MPLTGCTHTHAHQIMVVIEVYGLNSCTDRCKVQRYVTVFRLKDGELDYRLAEATSTLNVCLNSVGNNVTCSEKRTTRDNISSCELENSKTCFSVYQNIQGFSFTLIQ